MHTGSKGTVLFVDDEIINLFVFKKRFKEDFHVLTAENASDALQIIHTHKDELSAIVTDLRMPDIQGLELLEKTREIIDIPCFLLTGYEKNKEIATAINSGLVLELFGKPFDYELIKRKVSAAIY